MELSGRMQAGVPDEKVTIDGDTDRLDFKGGGCGAWGEGALPHARDQRGHVLQLEVEVRGLSASELHRLRETEGELGSSSGCTRIWRWRTRR